MGKKANSMATEFKKFITRGNVIDLAVGVIIGGAFGKIVTSLVNDLIMPLIGLILGKVNFKELKVVIAPATETVPESAFRYGAFIQSVIDFLIIALCIFFMIKAIARVQKKLERKKAAEEAAAAAAEAAVSPAPPEPTKEEVLLTEIRDILKDIKK